MAREASQITPPSGLRVNPRSAVPAHVQLQTQIRHLISTGGLKPGMQLPTVRQLAGFLRINRNTVARALAELGPGRVPREPPGPRHVRGRPTARTRGAGRAQPRAARRETLERARRLGFTHEELAATIAGQAPAAGSTHRTKVRDAAGRVQSSRAHALSRAARGRAPDRRGSAARGGARRALPGAGLPRGLPRGDHHVLPHPRGQAGAAADGPPALALLSESNISSLLRLTELPPGTPVGLICSIPSGSQNLLSSVQSAGLSQLVPVLASADDPGPSTGCSRRRASSCAPSRRWPCSRAIPEDAEVIRAHRRLDEGGIGLLRDLLAQLDGERA